MKNIRPFASCLLPAIFFVFLSCIAPLKAVEPSKDLETIARLTSTIIARQHFRQHPIDEEISTKLFSQYLKALDPNKLYFCKEDLLKFEPSSLLLGEQLITGNLGFPFVVYNEFVKKVRMHRDFAAKALSAGFDFNVDEEFVFDRGELPWAATQKELEEIWRKKLKNEVLTLRLISRAEKEDKAADKDSKESPHPSWSSKSPNERVLKRIDQYIKYLEKNEPIDVLEFYLSSLAMVYDPHSAYMSPRTEEDFNISMRLSLVGIGAVLSSEDGYTKIESIVPGGPADLDGRLKPDDRIIAVAQADSEPVEIIDMPLSRVVSMIRGDKDTKVILTVLPGAKGMNAIPETITITRNTVKLTDQEASGRIQEIKGKDGSVLKVGVIILPSFYMDFDAAQRGDKDYKSSTRDVKKLLENFKKEKVDSVLLDLRSNGGGSLVEAINLSGLFIKTGPIVQVKTNPGNVDVKCDEDDEQIYDGPLLILVNRLSASATEIFAGAMKDYERGLIVGDSHTHGKGTVQTIWELNQFLAYLGAKFPAGSVKFTNALFYRINGASTQIKGVTPDIVFPSFTDSMKIGEEDLPHALPWDEIQPVKHDNYNPMLAKLVPELKTLSEQRRKSNKKFTLLEKDIEIYKHIKDRKSISLNENTRWAEYLKEKKLMEEQNRLVKLDEDAPKKAAGKKGKKGEDDIYL
ncbi:MAG: hypothetical protein A2X49_15755, partial [Lentisphaerae bacterium GWF2_52_8]